MAPGRTQSKAKAAGEPAPVAVDASSKKILKKTALKDVPVVAGIEEPAPTKKRGRPKKEAPVQDPGLEPKGKRKKVEATDLNATEGLSSDQAAPQKHVQQSSEAVGRESQPPPIRSNQEESKDLPKGKAKNSKSIPTIQPQPTKKRTNTAAERAARKSAEKQLHQAQEASQKMELAKLHVAEEVADEQMIVEREGRLSAVMHRSQMVNMSDSGEEFDEVKDVSSTAESDVSIDLPKAIGRKSTKAAKGALRQEINDLTEAVHGSSGGTRRTKSGVKINNNAESRDTLPKKYANAGLCDKAPSRSKYHKKALDSDADIIGGLTEEDAHAERPPGAPHGSKIPQVAFPADLQCSKDRKNNLVNFLKDPKPIVVALKSQPQKSKIAAKKTSSEATQVAVPMKKLFQDRDIDLDTNWTSDRSWVKIFLPSLMHALYVSPEPFKNFRPKADEFHDTIQTVFDLSFPNVEYEVKEDDTLKSEAYNRLKSKRSKIASEIAQAVDVLFADKKTFANAIQIKEYARWALRPDGPGFYETPTPMKCRVPRNNPDYIPPAGIFQSKFILPTLVKYLHYSQGLALRPRIDATRPPKGLLVMILASVERAFKAYLCGEKTKQKKFSDDDYSAVMKAYWVMLAQIRESQWTQILTSTVNKMDVSECDSDDEGTLEVISAQRGQFYIPSSPMKEYYILD
ncbi:hypothetical protein B0H34DRAFT_791875 [Crassisporium funariophilum]|nr:hypothetical protein B0H34DRAFT_791875 [Crassisporium funariophilum]